MIILGSKNLEKVQKSAEPVVEDREVVDWVLIEGWANAAEKVSVQTAILNMTKKLDINDLEFFNAISLSGCLVRDHRSKL